MHAHTHSHTRSKSSVPTFSKFIYSPGAIVLRLGDGFFFAGILGGDSATPAAAALACCCVASGTSTDPATLSEYPDERDDVDEEYEYRFCAPSESGAALSAVCGARLGGGGAPPPP